MSGPVVVDASVLVDHALVEGADIEVARMMQRVGMDGAVAPQHLRLEVANAFAMRLQARRLDVPTVEGLLGMLERLELTYDDETSARAWRQTFALAIKHRLTIYDAAYFELAIRLGAELATFDKDLRKAAQSENVALV